MNWASGSESDKATSQEPPETPKSLTLADISDDSVYRNINSNNQVEGKYVRDLISSGESKIENWVPAAAEGGEVERSGLAVVHQGEPIVPADIAASSRLLDMLDLIANAPVGGDISTLGASARGPVSVSAPMTVNLGGVHISGQAGQIDEDSILRKVRDLLDQHLSRFELERLIEEVYVNTVRSQTG